MRIQASLENGVHGRPLGTRVRSKLVAGKVYEIVSGGACRGRIVSDVPW
jgi:hypothetical protein